MPADLEALRRLIAGDEGQYFDRKSLFHGPPSAKRQRDRKSVRKEIVEYVAAFANADGGTLVLGVEDDGVVTGVPYEDPVDLENLCVAPTKQLDPPQPRGEVVAIDEKRVVVFEVGPAPRAVRVVGDGYPRREGDVVVQSSEELINRLKDEGFVASPEARVADRATLADLEPELLARAAHDAGLPPDELLVARRLADRRGDELVLRRGAVWLFAKSPQAIAHPNLGVRVFRVHGTEQRTGAQRNVQDYPWIEGNLLAVLAETKRLLQTLIRSSARLHDLFFREMPEYPEAAWQEALVNALAHRDYGIESRCVEVWLYDDRLEIKSPGALLPDVNIDDLRGRKRVHASRNPRIARILTELGIMRQQGEGIPRMIEEMELSWLPPPDLEVTDREFRVVLKNAPIFEGSDEAWTHFVRQLPLDVRQKRALVAFHSGAFRSGDYQELNRVDRDTAYRELQELEQRGLVRADGATKARLYSVDKRAMRKHAPARSRVALVVARMKDAGRLTNTDVREAYGVERAEARRLLSDWTARGIVELRGERRGAHYVPGRSWPPREEDGV